MKHHYRTILLILFIRIQQPRRYPRPNRSSPRSSDYRLGSRVPETAVWNSVN